MDPTVTGQNENKESPVEIDSWEAAFAALEPKGKEGAEATPTAEPGGPGPAPVGENAEQAGGQQQVPDQPQAGVSDGDEGQPGGMGADAGSDGEQVGNAFESVLGVSEQEIEDYRKQLGDSIRDRAINEVAQEFINRGIRHTNGRLGATLDDDDICKRDSDGVPRFYNPETGREFTGDNPRKQAQEWVDYYNQELARAFNNACEQYEQHLAQESAPALAVIEFAPKYDKLDPIRKGMFENAISDYEVTDSNNNVVGYSCDLDKALAMVERQIEMIQGYAREHAKQQPTPQPQQQAGPVLDMKTSSGAIPSGDAPAPQSLAEAMERAQDALLDKMKRS